MKLKHLFLACISISLLVLASCKKEDKEKTTAEKIQAKWGVETIMLHAHVDNEDTSAIQPALSTDYFEFRPDNKVNVNLYGETDTLDYVLQNDNKILIKDFGIIGDDGLYDIQTLTDNVLKLYTKETDPSSPADYIEITINLKK